MPTKLTEWIVLNIQLDRHSREKERVIHLKLAPGAVCNCKCGKSQMDFYPLRVGTRLAHHLAWLQGS
jgi:hypothetical protein